MSEQQSRSPPRSSGPDELVIVDIPNEDSFVCPGKSKAKNPPPRKQLKDWLERDAKPPPVPEILKVKGLETIGDDPVQVINKLTPCDPFFLIKQHRTRSTLSSLYSLRPFPLTTGRCRCSRTSRPPATARSAATAATAARPSAGRCRCLLAPVKFHRRQKSASGAMQVTTRISAHPQRRYPRLIKCR